MPDDCDVAAFEELARIRDNIVEFIEKGRELYIYSSIAGNGKTTWAIKLMMQYFNEVWPGNAFVTRGIFVNVPTFLSMCKSTISNPNKDFSEMRDALGTVDLVVFDDIASTRLTEYDYNILLNYINTRYLNNKANIYTGNVNPKDLYKFVGDRLSSRIYNAQSICIELKGGDMR
jgi:DNA replication protein DnaC